MAAEIGGSSDTKIAAVLETANVVKPYNLLSARISIAGMVQTQVTTLGGWGRRPQGGAGAVKSWD
ncbi:MAG: hypothetical protein ACLQIB_39795 [Isosphaeraceae bacterium]